mmetsp:Transcript_29715/g.95974  ORF Transcript_29715/g.95974 Transcript_29715/m.95974 type:complete len:200 (+) Transcript_29715:710-1309(+)
MRSCAAVSSPQHGTRPARCATACAQRCALAPTHGAGAWCWRWRSSRVSTTSRGMPSRSQTSLRPSSRPASTRGASPAAAESWLISSHTTRHTTDPTTATSPRRTHGWQTASLTSRCLNGRRGDASTPSRTRCAPGASGFRSARRGATETRRHADSWPPTKPWRATEAPSQLRAASVLREGGYDGMTGSAMCRGRQRASD